MSKANFKEQKQPQDSKRGERPAVGIIADGEDANEVAGAILRAREHGCEPIVAATDSNTESLRFANQLGATVLTGGSILDQREEHWKQLAAVARKNGYPGLLRHVDLSMEIDYDASIESMAEESDYLVEPTLRSRVHHQPEVLAAIPAYNEGQSIADVVAGAMPHADEVVVIDDGSSDDTVEKARETGATVFVHDTNKGYGGALKTAFKEAERSGAAHLVILDGDGQHDPSDVPKLIAHQKTHQSEIVIGSRFKEDSGTAIPLYRRFGIEVVNVLTNLSMGVVRSNSWVGDTQSGFRAYNRRAIESLSNDHSIGDGMSASTDILHHAHHHGYELREFGTTIDYEVENASSQNPVSHGLTLVANILQTIERDRPVMALGIPGFLSSFIGLGFGYWTFHQYIQNSIFPIGLAVTSTFFTLAGIFACFTAIILHSLNTHLNDQQ